MHTKPLVAVIALLVAGTAWALSVPDLENQASGLHSDLVDLSARVDACPEGRCEDVPAILADQDALEIERLGLHAHRLALGECPSCEQLDSAISAIDGLTSMLERRTVAWEESS